MNYQSHSGDEVCIQRAKIAAIIVTEGTEKVTVLHSAHVTPSNLLIPVNEPSTRERTRDLHQLY